MEIIRDKKILKEVEVQILVPGKGTIIYTTENGLIGVVSTHGLFSSSKAIIELDTDYLEIKHPCHCLIKRQDMPLWQGVISQGVFNGFWNLQAEGYHYYLERFMVPSALSQYRGQTVRDFLQVMFINAGCHFIIQSDHVVEFNLYDQRYGGLEDARTLYQILVGICKERDLAFAVQPYLVSQIADITKGEKLGEIQFYPLGFDFANSSYGKLAWGNYGK